MAGTSVETQIGYILGIAIRYAIAPTLQRPDEKAIPEVKIDGELLYRMGIGIGYAAAPFLRGLKEGAEDWEIEQAARDIQEERAAMEAEEGLKRPLHKTEIGDCRKCWCDQCARIDACVKMREGALPDGVRPFPCVDCADGMRFKPREEAQCEDFVQAGGYNNG